ncbi:MAG: ABC transporter permease [Opitutaceae bacterium]
MNARVPIELRRMLNGRAIISICGLAVGIAAVFSLQSLTQSVRRETIARLMAGTEDVVSVEFTQRAASTETREAPRLSSEIVAQLESRLPSENTVATFGDTRESIIFGGRTYAARVAGVTPSVFDLYVAAPSFGRTLSRLDKNQPVALFGKTQARALAGEADLGSLIGSQFQLAETVFTVVGIVDGAEFGSSGRFALDDAIVVTADVYERRLEAPGVSHVLIGLRSPLDRETVRATLAQFFDSARSRGIKISSFSEERLQVANEFRMITLLLLVVGGVAFALGSLGIVNLLLGNLSDREREIGLRRALGATRSEIRRWFLFEALAACGAGVGAGLALGGILNATFSAWRGWDVTWSLFGALASAAIALIVGAIAGLAVGSNASNIEIPAAMRKLD